MLREPKSRRSQRSGSSVVAMVWLALAVGVLAGCPQAATVDTSRPPKAEKWFRRAQDELRVAAIEAAHDSIQQAMDLVPADEQVRILAAKVALARLEFAEVVRLLRAVKGTEAQSLLGRAYWYDGKLDKAAEALQTELGDPDVTDPWAKAVTGLALQGEGRKPYDITGALVVAVDLARVDPSAPLFVVPLEIDGDAAIALVSTANAEVVLDSANRREPSWVNLRFLDRKFGEQIEVRDVPALTQDLSQISSQLGAPIKALLGANLLRQLNVTIDLRGRQFVARSLSPPPPPVASRVDLYYLRGGGMVIGSALGTDGKDQAALFVDTSMTFPMALDAGGWKKLGTDPSSLPPLAADPTEKLRAGTVSLLRLGVLELPHIPTVFGAPIERMERDMNVDIDGVIGAGLLSNFRLTFADRGRVLWVEQSSPVPPMKPSTGTERPTPSLLPSGLSGSGLPGPAAGSNLFAPSPLLAPMPGAEPGPAERTPPETK